MSDAQQFQHARGHVGEFKDARPLLDCGHLEANQSSEARAIQMFYIRKVDNDATARKNDGPHQFFYLTCGVTDWSRRTCRASMPAIPTRSPIPKARRDRSSSIGYSPTSTRHRSGSWEWSRR